VKWQCVIVFSSLTIQFRVPSGFIIFRSYFERGAVDDTVVSTQASNAPCSGEKRVNAST
jgi:hypothetical protein